MIYVYIFNDCVECCIEIQLYEKNNPQMKYENSESIIYYETRKA